MQVKLFPGIHTVPFFLIASIMQHCVFNHTVSAQKLVCEKACNQRPAICSRFKASAGALILVVECMKSAHAYS